MATNSNHFKRDTIASFLSTTSTILGSPLPASLAPTTETIPPPIIPDEHDNRTLVICYDGTGNAFDADNSNVVEFFSMLKKDDPEKQVVYYHSGIGTESTFVTPGAKKVGELSDEGFAWSLGTHVMDGYEFLMQTYQFGDKICLFGFSRGAYAVRALAGMLYKVGLLPRHNRQQIPFAYKMYTSDDKEWTLSNNFKKSFSIDVKIDFVGVWDTVDSVGIVPRTLPFTSSNESIRVFRHAMALDERRAKFQPNPWNEPTDREKQLGIDRNNTSALPVSKDVGGQETDVREVWFAGCHSDVGGGSVLNGVPHCLSRNPLRWMIRQCFEARTGIMFYTLALLKLGFIPSSLYPYPSADAKPLARPPALSPKGLFIQEIPPTPQSPPSPLKVDPELTVLAATPRQSEENLERLDALSPIYDELSLKPSWYLLEIMPFKRKWQDGSPDWTITRWPNMGGSRTIRMGKNGKILVHRSVRTRMETQYADGKKYEVIQSLRDAIASGKVEWID